MQFGTAEMSGSFSATYGEQEAVSKILDVSGKIQTGQQNVVRTILLRQTFIL